MVELQHYKATVSFPIHFISNERPQKGSTYASTKQKMPAIKKQIENFCHKTGEEKALLETELCKRSLCIDFNYISARMKRFSKQIELLNHNNFHKCENQDDLVKYVLDGAETVFEKEIKRLQKEYSQPRDFSEDVLFTKYVNILNSLQSIELDETEDNKHGFLIFTFEGDKVIDFENENLISLELASEDDFVTAVDIVVSGLSLDKLTCDPYLSKNTISQIIEFEVDDEKEILAKAEYNDELEDRYDIVL